MIYKTVLLDFSKHRTVSKTLLILVTPGLQAKEGNYCLELWGCSEREKPILFLNYTRLIYIPLVIKKG